MRVTITVENGDQDVEITRSVADLMTHGGENLSDLGRVLNLAVADVQRACGIAGYGRCGKTMPHLQGDLPTHCALPHGHGGWHRDDDGKEMGLGW